MAARHSGAAGTSVTRTLPAPVISVITTFVCPVNHLFSFTTNFELSSFHVKKIEDVFLSDFAEFGYKKHIL